jgi:regulator of RNase E activity RraA
LERPPEHVAPPLSAEARERLEVTSTASLTSELLQRGFRNTFLGGVLPLAPSLRMVGYAFTLRYIPAREDLDLQVDFDNLRNPQRLAVEAVASDDVLVIDARGELGAASLGHILATRLLRRGAAGLVTDGALRDSDRIRELGLPAYAGGVHAAVSSVAHHPVDMNVPIACGGVAVFPRDVLVGDAEGVVVLPAAVAEEVAHPAWERDRLEEYVQRRVDAGASIRGVYPPDADTLAEYRRSREPPDGGGQSPQASRGTA